MVGNYEAKSGWGLELTVGGGRGGGQEQALLREKAKRQSPSSEVMKTETS